MRRLPVRTRASRKSLSFAFVIAVTLTAATGLALYNLDSAYVANKFNLVSYVPDKLSAGGDTSIIVMAMDDDGKPMANKPIDVVMKKDNYSRTVWSGVTDESGFATPVFDNPEESGSVDLIVSSGTEVLTTRTVVDDTIRIIITTDKPIYQPGQTAHIRILSFAGAQPLPQDSPVTVEVIDPNGDKVFKRLLSPNEYGIASYDLALSDQMIQGKYTIKAISGQRTASKEIIVKDYVLPKFRVSLLGMNEWYTVSESIRGTVDAEYFFGQYVQGTVAVSASVYYGVWTEIFNTTGNLLHGNFAFTIPPVYYAIGIPAAGGSGYLQLNVSVTDTGAHTETRSKIIPIAPSSVTVSVLTDSCVVGQESTFYVIARTPDGKAITNASTYAYLYHAGGAYHRLGPFLTDTRGVAEFTFVYDNETYGVFYADQGSKYGSATVEFGDGSGVKILPDESAYDIGDVGDFRIVYSGPSFTSNVYYDVVSRGYVISRGVLELVHGEVHLQVQMVPEMQPFTQVRVYKIEKTMDVSRDAVTFRVGDSTALAVDISADNESYAPRDEVTLDFNVTTGGQPILAALGVSVVDEAVYEVGSMFQGFEELIFGLDEEFILPQYQIISYVFAASSSLPSESEQVISEVDKARMASTWPENAEYADAIRDKAIQDYWLAVLVLATVAVVGGAGWSVRNGKRIVPIVLTFVVALSLVTTGIYALTTGFEGTGSSAPFMPRAPGGNETKWELAPAADSGFGFDDPLLNREDIEPTHYGDGPYYGSEKTTVVRNYFPETWYWNPCLLTDDNGRVNITLTAPDSITSWNVDAIASTVDGMIGSGTASLKVFQPFFIDPDIPVSVVRGDRFDLKIQVYNYDDYGQQVSVTIADEPWFDLLSPATKTILVPNHFVSYVNFTIVATDVGWHTISVHGESLLANDTVEKPMRVVPDGTKDKTLFNGEVENGTVTETLTLFPERINGSESAWVKLQGSVDAVLLEGVESFMTFVTGCGEQSLSMLSIDILAYDTMKSLGTSPEKLFEYESMVNQGLMHELTYLENANNGKGRGIVWFPGDQDVHPWLTSWGLIAFQDAINAGFGLDEEIIKDMQSWLISIQNHDGSWEFPDWGIYEFNNPLLKSKKIAATAYIARALLRSGTQASDPSIVSAVDFIENHIQEARNDSFSLALSLIVLQNGGGYSSLRSTAAAQLDSMKMQLNDTYYWSSETNLVSDNGEGLWAGNAWGGRSSARIIETTGYAIVALKGEGTYGSVVQGGVKYLLDHRSELGGWFSTQDTVVAFHTLKTCSGASGIRDVDVQVSVEGVEIFNITMDEFNRDVTYYVDLRPHLQNSTNVSVTCTGDGTLLYSMYLEQYVPWPTAPESSQFLTLTVNYDTTTIQLDDTVTAHMYLLYSGPAPVIKMMLVDLRSPMGLSFDLGDFEALKTAGIISAYDSNDRQVLVYLTDLSSGAPLEFDYSLVADMPIRSTVQDISAWDMYDPDNLRSEVLPVVFEVT